MTTKDKIKELEKRIERLENMFIAPSIYPDNTLQPPNLHYHGLIPCNINHSAIQINNASNTLTP